MGKHHDLKTPFECLGCACLSCDFKGDCHCPLKDNKTFEIPCDNYKLLV